ncbi:hypothetical protein AVEN_125320-1 [Araneus ventricosus]|uniref:Uncharacterized protein n=1 Tax=Araneus ventricosus TaxID=182803 RepID=A0A4Y2EU26_ARAVE|nr:hypothetical protein AVEN_125320-1 [Araneus ventricosus]
MMAKAKSSANACKWISSGRSVFTFSSAKIMSRLTLSCHSSSPVRSHLRHLRHKLETGTSWREEGADYEIDNVDNCLGQPRLWRISRFFCGIFRVI